MDRMNATPTETLFTCPNCKGYHFNVGVGGTLLCQSANERTPRHKLYGCGWIGRLPSEEPTKTIEPLPGLGSHKSTIGATNTAPTTPQVQIRTAEQAREATEQAVRKEFQEELTKIAEAIETHIRGRQTCLRLNTSLNPSIVWLLNRLGYLVENGSKDALISW